MMIHHRTSGGESILTSRKFVFVLWGAVGAASFFVSLFGGQLLTSLPEALVLRPILFGIAVFAMTGMTARFLARPFGSVLPDVVRRIPLAVAIGALPSLLSLWNDGTGVILVTFEQALTFLVTGGLVPRDVGPESFMRFSVLALAAFIGVMVWRETRAKKTTAVVALAAWLAGGAVLLIQSWLALFLSLFQEDVFIAQPQDAVRVLGILHTNSYWSSLQGERFFGVTSRPLATSVAFSTTALLFTLATIGLISLFRARREEPHPSGQAMFAFLRDRALLFFVSPALFAVIVGLRGVNVSWTLLDIVSVVVFGIVCLASYLAWRLKDQGDDQRGESCLILACTGAALLGWPVLFGVVAWWVIRALLRSDGGSLLATRWIQPVLWGATGAIFTAIGGAFAVRHVFIPTELLSLSLGWGVLFLAGVVAGDRLGEDRSAKIPLATALLGAAVFCLTTHSATAFIVFAISIIPLVVLNNQPEKWRRWAFLVLLLVGWAAGLLGVWVTA